MVLPLIPIALGLAAEFAPGLVRMFAGEKAGDVADKVAGLARIVTGKDDLDAATVAMRENPELALKFRQQAVDLELELERAYLADRQDARSRDVEITRSRGRNLRADVLAWTAIGGLILVVVLVFLVDVPVGPARDILLLLTGALIAIVKDVYGFEFGSSRGSKDKDGLLSAAGRVMPREPITWK